MILQLNRGRDALSFIIIIYYIDRCELWEFIREINSGISHVKYHFFPAGTTFAKL
jgi:hypothetical protein